MRGNKENQVEDASSSAPVVLSTPLRKAVSFRTRTNLDRFRTRRLGPELNQQHLQAELRKAIESGNCTRIMRYATLLGKWGLNKRFEQTEDIPPLYYALSIGCEVEGTRVLVNAGASVNLRVGPYGYTSLHYAIVGGGKANVRFLVEEGGLRGFTRRKCKLACLDAARLRQQEIFEYLESIEFVSNGKKLESTRKVITRPKDAAKLINDSAFESAQKTVSTKSSTRDATTLIDDSVFECTTHVGNVASDPAESWRMETIRVHQKVTDNTLAPPSPEETTEPDLIEASGFRSRVDAFFPSDEEEEEGNAMPFRATPGDLSGVVRTELTGESDCTRASDATATLANDGIQPNGIRSTRPENDFKMCSFEHRNRFMRSSGRTPIGKSIDIPTTSDEKRQAIKTAHTTGPMSELPAIDPSDGEIVCGFLWSFYAFFLLRHSFVSGGIPANETTVRVQESQQHEYREHICDALIPSFTISRIEHANPPLYDIFLVNTTAQKERVALPMMKCLQANNPGQPHGFHVFLDRCMRVRHGNTFNQMESALETCRYVVVLLSFALLRRKHPREELKYAFRRNSWLERHFQWTSLYIVLYDLTLEDYRKHRGSNPEQGLPNIDQRVLIQYGGFADDSAIFAHVKTEMMQSDAMGGREAWTRFLHARMLRGPSYNGCPSAHDIYSASKSKETQKMQA